MSRLPNKHFGVTSWVWFSGMISLGFQPCSDKVSRLDWGSFFRVSIIFLDKCHQRDFLNTTGADSEQWSILILPGKRR